MEHGRILVALALALFFGGVGCLESPPGDDDAGDDDAGDDDAGGDCDRYNTFGFFEVTSDADHGGASGGYYDGPWPTMLDALQSEGGCTLYGYDQPPHCDPPCESPLACGFGDVCRPWPEAHTVGAVTVSDAGGVLVELEETEYHYYLSPEALPDLYQPGATLTLTAAGGPDIAGFVRTVVGVDPWPGEALQETMVQGEDMLVEWTPGTVSGAKVRVHMDIDHHALLAGSLECIVDDAAGQVVIPQALVDALIETGHSGIGTYVENAYIDRFYTHAGEHDPGCVGFTSNAHGILYVETILAD